MDTFFGTVDKPSINIYGTTFVILTGLFFFRVFAQLVQLFFNFSWLPPFRTWQSGALPYWLLIILQIGILILCVKIITRFKNNPPVPNRVSGKTFMIVGGVYLFLAIIRMILGATVARDSFWLNAPLPSAFHIVLASFVIAYGHYHFRYAS